MHSAEDYNFCIAPLRRLWPNPLLRFTIFDETSPQKIPSVSSEALSLYNTAPLSLPDVMSKSSSPVVPPHNYALPQSFIPPPHSPLQPSTSCVHPPSRLSYPPPPPIILTPSSNEPRSLDERGMAGTAPCCSITKGKADIGVLLSTFKEELECILYRTFGTACVEQQSPPLVKGSTCGAFGNAVLSQTATPASGGANASRWCFVCRNSFTGVWYGCIKCSWHAVVSGLFEYLD